MARRGPQGMGAPGLREQASPGTDSGWSTTHLGRHPRLTRPIRPGPARADVPESPRRRPLALDWPRTAGPRRASPRHRAGCPRDRPAPDGPDESEPLPPPRVRIFPSNPLAPGKIRSTARYQGRTHHAPDAPPRPRSPAWPPCSAGLAPRRPAALLRPNDAREYPDITAFANGYQSYTYDPSRQTGRLPARQRPLPADQGKASDGASWSPTSPPTADHPVADRHGGPRRQRQPRRQPAELVPDLRDGRGRRPDLYRAPALGHAHGVRLAVRSSRWSATRTSST